MSGQNDAFAVVNGNCGCIKSTFQGNRIQSFSRSKKRDTVYMYIS